MASQIDPSKPTSGAAFTADVRNNFAAAASEITALQDADAAGPFLPLDGGGVINGSIEVTDDITGSIGAKTPSPGAFTSLTASGIVTLPTTTTAPFLSLNGGAMGGPITLSGPPTVGLHAATKTYVDGALSAINVPLAYKGGWNPSTNTSPTLATGGLANGVKANAGDFWMVTQSATTAAIDGITTWVVGDWAVSNGSVWQRSVASSTPYLPLVGGNLTGPVSGPSYALTGAGNMSAISGADDAYFLDADGGVLQKYSNSSQVWQFSVPLSAGSISIPSLTTATVTAANIIPTQISLYYGGTTLDSTTFAVATANSTPSLSLLIDPDGGVINKIDPSTGEWAHQKTTALSASLLNAGRYRTRLTCKPITFGASPNVNSTANTTYAAIFTTEGQGALWRFLVPSALTGPATISLAYAFSDSVNDGINPVIGGRPAPWTTATWINAGTDVEYIAQMAALNAAAMVAPTTFALPQADASNFNGANNPTQVFHYYLTDWMPGTGVLRADSPGAGACLVFVRLYVTTGTLQLAANIGDASGNWDQYWSGRAVRSYSQLVDGVSNPPAFTSTTRVGLFAVHGIQYESLSRGVAILAGGDSTTAGVGATLAVSGAWRQLAMAFSSVTTPVELFVSGQPASDYYTFDLQMGYVIDLVKPTIAYLQAWSRNSWKNNSLIPGGGAPGLPINGHGSTFQIIMGGAITAGDTVTVTLTDSNVIGSPLSVTYTVLAGDTLATVAAGVAAAVTATTALFSVNYRAFSNGVWCNVVHPSAPPTAGTVAVSGGATLTATGYFNYPWISQATADMSLAASLSVADRVEAYGGVYFAATLYGDIGMTLQTDATRKNVNAAIRAMTRAVVADYDTALSLATGPAGAPQIPVPALSADGIHPNDKGHTVEFQLLYPLFKAVYGLQ